MLFFCIAGKKRKYIFAAPYQMVTAKEKGVLKKNCKKKVA
jgi:hypothetical protein